MRALTSIVLHDGNSIFNDEKQQHNISFFPNEFSDRCKLVNDAFIKHIYSVQTILGKYSNNFKDFNLFASMIAACNSGHLDLFRFWMAKKKIALAS